MDFSERLDRFFTAARRKGAPERALEEVARLLLEEPGGHTVIVAQWDKIAGRHRATAIFGACTIALADPCEFLHLPDFDTPEPAFVDLPFPDFLTRTALFPALAAASATTARARLLPLTLGEQPVGLLILLAGEGTPPPAVPPACLARLSYFAASAISLARLRGETMAKSARLATLYEMSKNTGAILEPGDVMSSLTEAAKATIKFETGLLFLRDNATGKLAARRILGDTSAVQDLLDDPEGTEIGRVVESRDPMLFHHGRLKSCLCVPVAHESAVLGALFLGTEKPYAYDNTDLSSLGILTSHFTTIDHAIGSLLAMRTYAKSFLDSMAPGLVAIDAAGLVTHMNAPAAKLLDAGEEAEGRPYTEALARRPALAGLVTDVLQRGKVVERHEIPGAFGDLAVEITTSPFADGEGVRLGVALFLLDVTEERRLAESRRHTERLRALGEMTASIAHEIRNPLTGIKMISQLLADEVAGFNPRLLEYTNLQIKEIERLNGIVSGMLTFARPARPVLETHDAAALLADTAFLLDAEARVKRLTLERTADGRVAVRCDAAQIRQVLFNVILNAIDASHEDGTVTLDVRREGGACVFTVTDRGCGVTPEEQAHIFDPFFSKKERGTGLGLAIAHTIVKEHGGTITLDSTPGVGTTVRIAIPD